MGGAMGGTQQFMDKIISGHNFAVVSISKIMTAVCVTQFLAHAGPCKASCGLDYCITIGVVKKETTARNIATVIWCKILINKLLRCNF